MFGSRGRFAPGQTRRFRARLLDRAFADHAITARHYLSSLCRPKCNDFQASIGRTKMRSQSAGVVVSRATKISPWSTSRSSNSSSASRSGSTARRASRHSSLSDRFQGIGSVASPRASDRRVSTCSFLSSHGARGGQRACLPPRRGCPGSAISASKAHRRISRWRARDPGAAPTACS